MEQSSIDWNVYSPRIAQWYDRIMEAGYLEHERAADCLDEILRGKQKLLEVGVGTGLMAAKMIKRGYDVTGVDFTPEMLDQARRRLGDNAKLHKQNVVNLDLPEKYDAVYSEGGVWVMTRNVDGELFLESHIPDDIDNYVGFKNVVATMKASALFILSIQPVHTNLKMSLNDGAIYSQRVIYDLPHIHKEYYVEKDFNLLAFQRNRYRRIIGKERERILRVAGLEELGVDQSGSFYILRKVAK